MILHTDDNKPLYWVKTQHEDVITTHITNDRPETIAAEYGTDIILLRALQSADIIHIIDHVDDYLGS
jgi:hypothetical protein